MKNLLILALVGALVGALYISRPQPQSFYWFAKHHPEVMQASGPSPTDQSLAGWSQRIGGALGGTQLGLDPAKNFCNTCTYVSRYGLWTNVERNGQVIYTGVASKWFKRDGVPASTPANATPSGLPS